MGVSETQIISGLLLSRYIQSEASLAARPFREGVTMNMIILASSLLVTQPAAAPIPLSPLAQCRRLADAERLRCYDEGMARLEGEIARGTVMVVGKDELAKTRRSLFGLRLPSVPLFSRGGADVQDSVESTIRSVRAYEPGKWEIVLADGEVWQTTEADTRSFDPRVGAKVTIKRASLGSYTLRWADGRPQRARRIA
jgi:hypothetical protein